MDQLSGKRLRSRGLLRAGLGVTLTAAVLTCGSVIVLATGVRDMGARFESSFRHEREGSLEEALAEVLAVLSKHEDHYVATLRAGWLSYCAGRHGEAVRFYRCAEKLEPKALEPRLGAMLPLMAGKRWREAEETGLRVLRRAPRSYLARSRLAYICFAHGRYAEAETWYRVVLADYPSDVEMRLGLGWTYARQGRKGLAREQFEEVLSIRPSNESALLGLKST
ncbi:tetratricopeptide repeat protein [Planctomycetota bacterium]